MQKGHPNKMPIFSTLNVVKLHSTLQLRKEFLIGSRWQSEENHQNKNQNHRASHQKESWAVTNVINQHTRKIILR